MKEVLNVIETHTKLYEEIIQKALDFEQLQERQQTLEIENGRKLKELQSIQSVLLQSEENQQDLTSRNGVLRDKFSELDENVKNKAKGISAELKRLCKQLGIKVKIEQSDQVNEEIFSLKFSESKEHEITFIYDLITEDYNLLKIEPAHPRFDHIRRFLWETKDVQGFLFNYRHKLVSALINPQ